MKLYIQRIIKLTLGLFLISSPLLAFAQTITNAQNLFSEALEILNDYVVPVIFAIAFIMFLWGVYRYFIAGGANEEKVKEGQRFVLWSVIGFVLMFSIWGIINLFINTLGFDTTDRPAFPTFGNSVGGGSSFFSGLGGGTSPYGSSPLGGLFGGSGSSPYTSGLPPAGQTFLDQATGQSFMSTGPNTYMPNNGTCGSMGTLNGSQCTANNSNGTYAPPGNLPAGTYGQGTPCGTGATICSGNMECNDATQTCQAPGPQTYFCNDEKPANAQTNLCDDGNPPINSQGNEAPENGAVPLGGSCAGNEDACGGTGSTCNSSGICATSYDSGDTGGDTTGGGDMQTCGDGTQATTCYFCSGGTNTAYPSLCPEDGNTINDGFDGNGSNTYTDGSGNYTGPEDTGDDGYTNQPQSYYDQESQSDFDCEYDDSCGD